MSDDELVAAAHRAYYESESQATWHDRLNVSPTHDAAMRAAVEAVRTQIAAQILATRDRHRDAQPLGLGAAPADRWALTYDYAARIVRGEP